MSEIELYDLLNTLNVKVAYDHFKNDVEPPFILYRNNDSTTFKADDKVHCKYNQYIIDLITNDKNTVLENLVEQLLNDYYLAFDKNEDFIESEQIYQIRYFI